MGQLTSRSFHDPDILPKYELADVFVKHRSILRQTILDSLNRRSVQKLDPLKILEAAFLQALNGYDNYRFTRPIPLLDWLRKLCKNAAKKAEADVRRTLDRNSFVEMEVESGAGPITEMRNVVKRVSPEIEKRESERRKLGLLKLPAHEQEIIGLCEEMNLGIQQVAEVLGISQKEAERRYYQAIRNLTYHLAVHSESNGPR
ncbi:MAG: hypothetical protein AAF939_22770 [Planctomycetota bacterium]